MLRLTGVTAFSFGFVALFSGGLDFWPAILGGLWIAACLIVAVAFLAPIPRIIREAKAKRAAIEVETVEIVRRATLLEAETEARIAALDRGTALIDIETTAIRAWQ
jgi:hypothetical protein